MKTYIERLNSEHEEKRLVKTLNNELLNVEASYVYENPFLGELTLRKRVGDDVVIRAYQLTDYTCEPINHQDDLAFKFFDDKVRKIYLSFMGRTFSDYKKNYSMNINRQTPKNLGETI